MELFEPSFIAERAVEVLKNASSATGILASSEFKDNYNKIWARDTAVSGLAIITNRLSYLYKPLKSSLINLQKASSAHGQIPSNIQIGELDMITNISFGGPVGRVDTSFWWIIVSVIYLGEVEDKEFETIVYDQCHAIFDLAESWEFNGKGLMYVPISSNWADEYVTNGYVLYDQILRYWALLVAAEFFKRKDWSEKAQQIKVSIKQHYLFEGELGGSLYTGAQQEFLKNLDIRKSLIASFSPGECLEIFDGWSVALLLLLNIPSEASLHKLDQVIIDLLAKTNQKGIPAFWPVITEADALYNKLSLNYNYQFKNKPGHFHNGGIWPVINGFLIAGLTSAGFNDTASLLIDVLHSQISINIADNPFSEYFDFYNGDPYGVNNLCFSASGYLLATAARRNFSEFGDQLRVAQKGENTLFDLLRPSAENLLNEISLNSNQVIAVSVAGESGSGKTTLTTLLAEILSARGFMPLVLHLDDYFILPPKLNHQFRLNDFSLIGPAEVRMALLDKHIQIIKQQRDFYLDVPCMNWVTDTEETKKTDIRGVNIILIDGTYSTLLSKPDYRILINTSHEDTKQSRISRNRENVTPFIEKVLKRESEIIKAHAEMADIIIDSKWDIITTNSNLKNN